MRRNLELENWLIETTGQEMMANHLGPNWNRFNDEVGFYPNITMTVADQVWQHQQSKVDELQKKNAWLSGVACRENKRANKLQEEKVSTTTLLGKTIQEKNELQKRVDAALIAFEKLKDEINELHGQCDLHLIKYLEEKSQVLEQALKGGIK